MFSTEAELRQHSAREHGNNMSRAEKRQALAIPTNFQVCAVVAIVDAVPGDYNRLALTAAVFRLRELAIYGMMKSATLHVQYRRGEEPAQPAAPSRAAAGIVIGGGVPAAQRFGGRRGSQQQLQEAVQVRIGRGFEPGWHVLDCCLLLEFDTLLAHHTHLNQP